MENKKKEVVYAFIDSQNLNRGVRNDIRTKDGKHYRYKGWNLDFAKFYQYLKDVHHVQRAFVFIGFIADNQDLYDSLSKIGYELVYKPILEITNKENADIKIKGNIDAEMVLHAMIHYAEYDKAIVVSGDGDFLCLEEYLEQHGKLGKIIISNKWNYSSLLEKYAEYFVNVNDLKRQLRYSPRRKDSGTENGKGGVRLPRSPKRPRNDNVGSEKSAARETKTPVPSEPIVQKNDGKGPRYFGM